MKSIFPALAVLISITATAQNKSLSDLLTTYYQLKNELVAGNSTKAAAFATEFKTAVAAINLQQLSPTEKNVFEPLKQKLMADAGTIASADDIKKQREVFASLSDNMIALAKGIKMSDKEVYIDYCPMKKASWLSAEKAIKNPYYGNSMLTCGCVKETIKH